MNFPASYQHIISRLDMIDPLTYGKTRNYINGAITFLSPYISRGVLSGKQVMDFLLNKGYTLAEMEKLVQQLTWREFFQRTWQQAEDDIFEDMRLRYTGVRFQHMPDALLQANTGIDAIDSAIRDLYQHGYLHNHLRLYIASLACNIGKTNWKVPASWMYYHLLDGDLASNALSWQWVSGHFSSKQYFCNQENINKYTGSTQQNSFLDTTYEALPHLPVPETLLAHMPLALTTNLPNTPAPQIDPSLPTLLYTSYNLDPVWRSEIKANRILLLEPSHFRQYPVSDKVLEFILSLSKNIAGLQVFAGELNEIPGLNNSVAIYSKEHPAFRHFPGQKDERDWLFPDIKGSFHSFFGFWKKCEASLRKREKNHPALQRA